MKLVADMRMKPASVLLGPVADAVAQLAERKGKQVRTQIEGLEHRLPPRLAPVFDQIGHLVRNSVDHGIEAPLERGDKAQTATVSVGVHREPGVWRVVVEDDGRGLDGDRLAKRAVEVGAIDAKAVAAMSEQERLTLVFVDGLSTAEGVTETSGRGVGMAAVLGAVESVGGRIEVRSERGRGTRFEIVVPDPVEERPLVHQ